MKQKLAQKKAITANKQSNQTSPKFHQRFSINSEQHSNNPHFVAAENSRSRRGFPRAWPRAQHTQPF